LFSPGRVSGFALLADEYARQSLVSQRKLAHPKTPLKLSFKAKCGKTISRH
jgi:hypothetical protein